MPQCICPVVDIKIAKREHIDDSQMRTIADMLYAAVTLQIGDEPGQALFGKHRDDCPCGPRNTPRTQAQVREK